MASANPKKISGGSSSFVIMVGDEGAILVQMQKKRVVRRLFAQSPDPQHTHAFDEALKASPNAPITLLVDIMDQSYVRQTLPPVSSLSVGKIVKRRLDKDFSPDDITGYRILDRETTGRKDWNYLMVSLANPPLLQKWLAFLVERPNAFKGMGLIPMEGQAFLAAAEKTLLLQEKGKDAKPAEWQILVNHHKVGGFRQIVLHNGKLIFTRMAQPIGESLPDVIAGNIEQEMTNTVEYLKRLGLQGPDAVSVIVIASEDIKKALDSKNIKAGTYHFFTPFEIAELLAINDAAQPEDQFGDVVISAFIAKKRSLLLPLNTPYTKILNSFAQAMLGARTVAAVLLLSVLGWAGSNAFDIVSTKQDTDQLVLKKGGLVASKTRSTQMRDQILPKHIDMFTDVQTMALTFDKRRFDPLVFVSDFTGTLQTLALVSEYKWALNTPMSVTKDTDKRQLSADIKLHVLVPLEPHNVFLANAKELISNIEKKFSDFDVVHSELPGVLSDSQELKTVIDDTTNASTPQTTTQTDSAIKITINGPSAKSNANHH